MHGAEARWNLDMLLDNQATRSTVNEYAAELLNRLGEAYRTTRNHLGNTAAYEKSWYDKRVKEQNFQINEKIRVLDQRGYRSRTPKWALPYSQIGTVIAKLNDVTYVVTSPKWRQPRVLHVDKLKRLENQDPSEQTAN
jgi:hypothetical protein